MSLDVYLQTFKCLSSLDTGILWLGLIGQCTNFELLAFNLIREKTNIIKPTLHVRPVMYTYASQWGTHSGSLMLVNFEVALPEMAPIHTCFIRLSFVHFNWHNTFSISRAVRLKNKENSWTLCSLSAILDLLFQGTGTSLPYLGGIRHVRWEGEILCMSCCLGMSWEKASQLERHFWEILSNMGCCRGRNILLFILVLQMVGIISCMEFASRCVLPTLRDDVTGTCSIRWYAY